MAIFKHVLGGPQSAGDQWTSGFHSQGSGPVESAHAAFAAQVQAALAGQGLAQWLPAATTIGDLTTYLLDTATGRAQAVTRSGVNIVGTGTGAQPSPRDAVVCGLRTAIPGPRGRGRMYLPAPSLNNWDADGLLAAAARQGIANAVGAMLGGMAGAGYVPGLFHLGNAAVDAFNAVTVGTVAGTQRRRTNKIKSAYASRAVA